MCIVLDARLEQEEVVELFYSWAHMKLNSYVCSKRNAFGKFTKKKTISNERDLNSLESALKCWKHKTIAIYVDLLLYRIAQDDYKTYLKGIQENSDLVTGTLEEMASELQRKFEALVTDDNEVYEKACKGMLC